MPDEPDEGDHQNRSGDPDPDEAPTTRAIPDRMERRQGQTSLQIINGCGENGQFGSAVPADFANGKMIVGIKKFLRQQRAGREAAQLVISQV